MATKTEIAGYAKWVAKYEKAEAEGKDVNPFISFELYQQFRKDYAAINKQRVREGKPPITHIQRELEGRITRVSNRQARNISNKVADKLSTLSENEKAQLLAKNPDAVGLIDLTPGQLMNKLKYDHSLLDTLIRLSPRKRKRRKRSNGYYYVYEWFDSP